MCTCTCSHHTQPHSPWYGHACSLPIASASLCASGPAPRSSWAHASHGALGALAGPGEIGRRGGGGGGSVSLASALR